MAEKPVYTFEPLRTGFRGFGKPQKRMINGRLHIHYPREGQIVELQGGDIQGTTVGNMTTYPTMMEERPLTNIIWGYIEQDERVREQIGTYVVDLTSGPRASRRPIMNSWQQYANAEDEAIGDVGPVSRNASYPMMDQVFNIRNAQEAMGFAGINVTGRASPWDRATSATRSNPFLASMPAEAREAYFEQTKQAKVRKRERIRQNLARAALLADEQDMEED